MPASTPPFSAPPKPPLLEHARLCGIASLVGCALLATGCTNLPKGPERVSSALKQRTGHGVDPAPVGTFTLPRGVTFAGGLSTDEAVAIALCNNAAFLETLADLGIARADVVQAGMVPNPTLSLLFPSGSKQLEFTARLASDVLWLRPLRLKAAKQDYERTATLLVQNGLNLIRDVKLAHAELLAAEERLKLAEEANALSARIEQFARARVDAGEASELEVATVGTDTLQSAEIVTRARQDVAIATERLRSFLGLGLDRRPFTATAPTRLFATRSPEALVKLALAARPDLRAAELGVEAAGSRSGLAKAEIFNLTVALDANRNKIETNQGAGSRQRIESGLGLDVTIPIFNQNQGGRARASAQAEKAVRQYYTVRDRIVLEVREAHLRLLQAQQSYGTWHTRILPPLEAAVDQAEGAFQSGNAPLLLVLENTRKRTEARARAAAAQAEVSRARAELERAVGGNIFAP